MINNWIVPTVKHVPMEWYNVSVAYFVGIRGCSFPSTKELHGLTIEIVHFLLLKSSMAIHLHQLTSNLSSLSSSVLKLENGSKAGPLTASNPVPCDFLTGERPSS